MKEIDKLSDLDDFAHNERFKLSPLRWDVAGFFLLGEDWYNNRGKDNFVPKEQFKSMILIWKIELPLLDPSILEFVGSNDEECWEESVEWLVLAYDCTSMQ